MIIKFKQFDSKFDYYGKRFALGTSEGKILIFENTSEETSKKITEFNA